jgi:hypothetical protein
MASTSVGVDEKALATIRELSKSGRKPIGQVIADAVKRYEDQKFWKEMHEGFAGLRADTDAWNAYQHDLAQWETLDNFGLEDEQPHDTEEEAAHETDGIATSG